MELEKLEKLENIENGIVDLLSKKYSVDSYNENINTYKTKIIPLDKFITNIDIPTDLLNRYLEIDSILCSYDIDILNLVLKYINLKNKLNKPPYKKYTFRETIYYYLGYDREQQTTISKEYFEKKSKDINIKIKSKYLQLFNLMF